MTRRPNVFGLSRDLWDHPLFADEPFTEREAWAWLIGAAAWKQIHTRGNVCQVTLERGEFSFAIRFLAEKWQWDKSRVHRFIGRLIKNDMVREIKRDSNQVFSICNYSRFQIVGLPSETAARQRRDGDETAARQQRDKEETGESLNRETKEVSAPAPAVATDSPHDLFDLQTGQSGAEVVVLVPGPERDAEAAVETYNLAATYAAAQGCKWPKCEHLHDTRRKKLKARLKECGGLEGWKEAMKRAARSPHLLGQLPRKPEYANWRPDFDFFLQQKSFARLMEGGYDDHEGTKVQRSRNDNLLAGAALYLASLDDDDEQGRPGEAGDDAYGPGRALLAP